MTVRKLSARQQMPFRRCGAQSTQLDPASALFGGEMADTIRRHQVVCPAHRNSIADGARALAPKSSRSHFQYWESHVAERLSRRHLLQRSEWNAARASYCLRESSGRPGRTVAMQAWPKPSHLIVIFYFRAGLEPFDSPGGGTHGSGPHGTIIAGETAAVANMRAKTTTKRKQSLNVPHSRYR